MAAGVERLHLSAAGFDPDATISSYSITLTELLGLMKLAAVAECANMHALAPEVQAALAWLGDVSEATWAQLNHDAPASAAFVCHIEDPSGAAVASGASEDEARERATVRFREDTGHEPSSRAEISITRRTA